MAMIGVAEKTSGRGQSPLIVSAAIREARVMSAMMLIARIAMMAKTRVEFGRGVYANRTMATAARGCRPEMTNRDHVSPPSAKRPTAAVNKVKRMLMMERTIKVIRKAVMVRF